MTHKSGLLILLMALGFLSVPLSAAKADDWHGDWRGDRHRDWRENNRGARHHHHEERVVYYYPTYRPVIYDTAYGEWGYQNGWNHGVKAGVPFYQVGDILPRSVRLRCHEPARHVVAALPPVPVGARYVQVDSDIYLISEATKRILDAVVLASAIR